MVNYLGFSWIARRMFCCPLDRYHEIMVESLEGSDRNPHNFSTFKEKGRVCCLMGQSHIGIIDNFQKYESILLDIDM